jgi:hypothetical protein
MYGASQSQKIVAYKAERAKLDELGIGPRAAKVNTALQMQTIFGEIALKLPKTIAAEARKKTNFGVDVSQVPAPSEESLEQFWNSSGQATANFFMKVLGGENVQEPLKQLNDEITDAIGVVGCEFLRAAGVYLGTAYGAAAGAAGAAFVTGGNPLAGAVGGYAGAAAGGALGGLLGDAACELFKVLLDIYDAIFGWAIDFIFSLFEPDDPREVNDFGETLRPVGWTRDSRSEQIKMQGQIYLQRMKKRVGGKPKGKVMAVKGPTGEPFIDPKTGQPATVVVPVWPKLDVAAKGMASVDVSADLIEVASYTVLEAARLQSKHGYVLWYDGPKGTYGKMYDDFLDFSPWDFNEIKDERKEFFPMLMPVLDLKEWKECGAQARKLWGNRLKGTKINSCERQWLQRRISELGGGDVAWKLMHEICGDSVFGILTPPDKSREQYDATVAEFEGKFGAKKGSQQWNMLAPTFNTVLLKALVGGGYSKPEALKFLKIEDKDGLAGAQHAGLLALLGKYIPTEREKRERTELAKGFSTSAAGRASVSLLTAKEFDLLPPQTLLQFEANKKQGKVLDPKFIDDVIQNRDYADSILRAMKKTGGIGPLVGLAAIVGTSVLLATPIPLAIGAGLYLLGRSKKSDKQAAIDELKKGGDPFKGAWSSQSQTKKGSGSISSLSSSNRGL